MKASSSIGRGLAGDGPAPLPDVDRRPGAVLADRVEELTSWDDVHMLRVQVNRLRRWEQHRECHTDIPHRAVMLAAMLTTLLSNVVQRHQRVAQPSASGRRRAS